MAAESRVMIVHIRRPDRSRADTRSDPFWEFGSFGMTKCHARNLMNPKRAGRLDGVRLAFAQGGPLGARLVYLTPPVTVERHSDRVEARWSPHKMPFRYADAPILVCNGRPSDFPLFAASMERGGRSKPEGQFSSNFRTRAHCLEDGLAREIVDVYTEMRARARRSAIARHYADALPCDLQKREDERERERRYARLVEEARKGEPRPEERSRLTRRRC